MGMNRKEFQLIADTIYWQREMIGTHITEEAFRKIVRDFSDTLSKTNQLFDRDRFAHAAGWCNEYNGLTLPDEDGKCSLCGKHKV